MKAVTGQIMRELDAGEIAAGTSGDVLMERAGRGAFDAIRAWIRHLPKAAVERLLILCGKGNNGGDGYVVGRLAAACGWPVTVVSSCPLEALTGDAARNAARLPDAVTVTHLTGALPATAFAPGTLIVDALLGTGISGAVRQPVAGWIRQVNASGLPVVSLDVPSGLNSDDGVGVGPVIQAALTVTMGLPKTGLFMGEGPACRGRVRCVDIGLSPERTASAESALDVITAADVAPFLKPRPFDGHKRVFGALGVLGGSATYTGAPMLAGEAGLRTGCGLVTIIMPSAAAHTVDRGCRALMIRALDDHGSGCFSAEMVRELHTMADDFDAVVAGCGMTAAPGGAAALGEILGWDCPKVIDADALRLLACFPQLLHGRKNTVILTPHPGEFKALWHGFFAAAPMPVSRWEQAVQLAAETDCVVVLKGAGTLVASPTGDWTMNTTGDTALATAGTGDVLAGMIGGFTACGLPPWEAALCGVFLHGLAGEISDRGVRGLIADDLPGLIPEAMRMVNPLA
ncbi:MAG: NAD(P)H-hydrate dehydratase [Lentisphaeria bacterium]|nr:NAD(P)H-hydrate dehydratase [Lentisphaeria bacterium]